MGGNVDLYGYCLNNPINWFDSTGLIIGSLLTKVLGGLGGASGQEAWIAGKVADSLIAIGISAGLLPPCFSGLLGPGTEIILQVFGGGQAVHLAIIIAGGSTVHWSVPTGIAAVGGVQIGLGFNKFYKEYLSSKGQDLGADFYDVIHEDILKDRI